MGRLINLDETMKNLAKANMSRTGNEFERFLLSQSTVEAIPKADYEARLKADIADKSVDKGYLYDWYISSVTDDEPKWTEAHLKELVNDFYLIPKQESKDGTNEKTSNR